MLEAVRCLVGAFMILGGAVGILGILVEPRADISLTTQWVVNLVWLSIGITLTKWKWVARRLNGKRNRAKAEQRKEAFEALSQEGALDRVLEEVRRNLGEAPRQFSDHDLSSYLQTTKPKWCNKENPFNGYFETQEDLLRNGHVVWGRLIQANSMLFNPGPHDAPGDIIYCLNPEERGAFSILEGLVQKVGPLKDTIPVDPAERTMADHLTNERTPAFGMPVPQSICWWAPCALSTIYFDRRHLPDGVLSLPFFPVLLSPTEPRYVMVVPSRYWTDVLKTAWAP